MSTKLVLNLKQFHCLCLPGIGIKGGCHYSHILKYAHYLFIFFGERDFSSSYCVGVPCVCWLLVLYQMYSFKHCLLFWRLSFYSFVSFAVLKPFPSPLPVWHRIFVWSHGWLGVALSRHTWHPLPHMLGLQACPLLPSWLLNGKQNRKKQTYNNK